MLNSYNIFNIPFWVKDEQSYLNVVTSEACNDIIVSKIRSQKKIDTLFWYLPGFRTASSTKKFGKTIRVPNDINKQFFRVPPSETLKQFYELAGAIPRKVSWKDAHKAAKLGAIYAMDSSIVGLYSGPNGLRNHIGTISSIDSVYDGWIAIVSQTWLSTLDNSAKSALQEAAHKTFEEHLIRSVEVRQNCIDGFKTVGVDIYNPTPDEKAQWVNQCGHSRPEWRSFKKGILGNEALFDQLLEASLKTNQYILPS